MDKDQLIEIANTEMPFGKYKGRRLIDVPEEYLLWFARKDQFPAGHLGEDVRQSDERQSRARSRLDAESEDSREDREARQEDERHGPLGEDPGRPGLRVHLAGPRSVGLPEGRRARL